MTAAPRLTMLSAAILAAYPSRTAPPVVPLDDLMRAIDVQRRMLAVQQYGDRAMEGDQLNTLSIYGYAAVADIVAGRATDEHISNLALLANVALMLAQGGLGEELADDIRAGQMACVAMWERYARTGRVGVSGEQLQDLRRLLEIHDAQLESGVTDAEMLHAMQEVNRARIEGRVLGEIGVPTRSLERAEP